MPAENQPTQRNSLSNHHESLTEILGMTGDTPQAVTAKDLALLLEIDLKLGRRKEFYDRLQKAMDFLLEKAEGR